MGYTTGDGVMIRSDSRTSILENIVAAVEVVDFCCGISIIAFAGPGL